MRGSPGETWVVDRQHDALKLLMNGNHMRRIRHPRSILDIGTGTGAWAIDVAREFTTADEVVGVDIELVKATDYPLNCRFEVLPVLKRSLIPDCGHM